MIARVAGLIVMGALCMAPARLDAQVRDSQRAPVGTGSISGVVMSDATPSRPVRRAMVTLGSGGLLKVPVVTITDDNGAFVFTNLPPGAFTLVATKPAWVATAYDTKTYGRGSGVPISLGAGQALDGLILKMLHGSVITGAVRDGSGRPASDVEMILLSVQTLNGVRKLTPILQSTPLDKRGEYRIFGLAPGDYILRAQPTPRFGQGDLRPTTPAELEWAKQTAALQSAAGAAGAAPDAPAPPASGRPVTYAPTYYPGTPDASGATLITLGPNEEKAGIDFATALVPVSTISGRVTGPDGLPPRNAIVTMQSVQASGTSVIDMVVGLATSMTGVRVGPDGRLSGSGITPGRYRMLVRGAPGGGAPDRSVSGMPAGTPAAAAALAGMMTGMASGTSTLWASVDLDIAGQDITDLDIRLQPGMTMSGTIVFEGEDPQKPEDASRINVSLSPASREARSALEMMAGMFQTATGRATKDRTFTVTGLTPDSYRASFLPPGAISPLFGSTGTSGWVLKSAVQNGKDLADHVIDLRSGEDITGVVVTFTRAATEIAGRLENAAGQPVSGFPIVVFPTDRGMWSPGSRRIAQAKPSSDGRYKVTGLPAGEYYVCTLSDLDPNDLYDAAFLEQLVAGSFTITLGEGEKKQQDLRIGGVVQSGGDR